MFTAIGMSQQQFGKCIQIYKRFECLQDQEALQYNMDTRLDTHSITSQNLNEENLYNKIAYCAKKER
jgi:hypothetical protein